MQNTTLSPQALRNLLERRHADAVIESIDIAYLTELFKFWYDELEFAWSIEVASDMPKAVVLEIDEHEERIRKHLEAIQQELEELLFDPPLWRNQKHALKERLSRRNKSRDLKKALVWTPSNLEGRQRPSGPNILQSNRTCWE
jgi:hypothetical protein